VPDRNDDDEQHLVFDRIDYAIPSHSDAISVICSGELLAAVGPRIVAEPADRRHDSLSVLLGVDRLDLLGRGRFDEALISCHAA
jgi:hypothetical protein